MKSVLITIASIIIFLGALRTNHVSYAMSEDIFPNEQKPSSPISAVKQTDSEIEDLANGRLGDGNISLPNELMLHTFSFLDANSIYKASKVCCLWNQILETYYASLIAEMRKVNGIKVMVAKRGPLSLPKRKDGKVYNAYGSKNATYGFKKIVVKRLPIGKKREE